MAFDREGAKAAGYSDAEIDTYLASRGGPPAPAPNQYEGRITEYTGPEDEPIEANPLLNPIELAIEAPALIRGGVGLLRAAPRIGSAAGRIGGAVVKEGGRAFGRRVLGKGNFDDLAKGVARAARGEAKQEVGSAASRVAQKAAPKAAAMAEKTVTEKAAPKLASKAELGRRVKTLKGYEKRAAAMEKPAPKAASKIAGEIKPAPKGSAESRVIAKPRHDVQYFSKSQGKHINIEDMNQKHIEQAYRSLAATNPKPGSVARRQMDALLEESKYRLQTTGIHIGQAS